MSDKSFLKGGKLLGPLVLKNPKGDTGRRASKELESMNAMPNREKVSRGRSLGGRSA